MKPKWADVVELPLAEQCRSEALSFYPRREFKRKILYWETFNEECESFSRGRRYSWRSIRVTTLILECGHERVHRGGGCPTMFVFCKDCEIGEPARVPRYPEGAPEDVVKSVFAKALLFREGLRT